MEQKRDKQFTQPPHEAIAANILVAWMQFQPIFKTSAATQNQRDYLFWATEFRWKLDEYIKSEKTGAKLKSILKNMQDNAEDLQTEIYYASHHFDSDMIGETISSENLTKIISVFRAQMADQIYELVAGYDIVLSPHLESILAKRYEP